MDDLSICRPFLDRLVALAAPGLILAVGAVAARALLEREDGIGKLRGTVQSVSFSGVEEPVPLVPIMSPAYLLNRPEAKRTAWRDLLAIEKELGRLGIPLAKLP